jgi:AraC family transcriptional regulator
MQAHWVSDTGSKNERFIAGSGICVSPISQPHSMQWRETFGAMMMLVQAELLNGDDANRRDLAWTGEGIYGERDYFLEHLGTLLADAASTGLPVSRLQAESTAVLIMRHLNRRPCHFSVDALKDGRRFNRLKEFIAAHLGEDLSVVALANVAQMSPFHFGRVFKASLGLSPHQYILKQRLEKAKQLLLIGQLTIAEIAQECGFAAQAHLTTAFRMHIGTTPKQFQNDFRPRIAFTEFRQASSEKE